MSSYRSSNRMQHDCLSLCPPSFMQYAARNLDSIGKIINHVLAMIMVCNVLLFLAASTVSLLPQVGVNVLFVAILLMAQTAYVTLVLNPHIAPSVRFLSPTPLTIGIALGTTIGAIALTMVISGAYRRVSSSCTGGMTGLGPAILNNATTSPQDHKTTVKPSSRTSTTHAKSTTFGDPLTEYYCDHHKGALTAVWFWSGLLLWFNFCSCLLLAVGSEELSFDSRNQYQDIGAPMPPSAISDQQHSIASSSNSYSGQSFVGDYSNIPEIRTHDQLSSRQQQLQQQQSSSRPSSLRAALERTSGTDRAQVMSV